MANEWASAMTHWYDKAGRPVYEVERADKKGMRPTTLRDARKMGLVPSVTGIIRCAAAPQLEKWKRDQVLIAALTLPRMPEETEQSWLSRVEQDWQEQGRAAADRGTAIHAAVEQHFRGEAFEPEFTEWVSSVNDAIIKGCGPQRWNAERSFADARGYGGKTDLHSGEWVVDVKTKDSPLSPVIYDEHLMQLAAYREGLNIPGARCGILFVGRDQPKAILAEASPSELQRGWEMFNALLTFWQAQKAYRP